MVAGKGFFALTALVLTVCLVLGGATRPGYLADVFVQLAAVPLLLWSLWRLSQGGTARMAWPLAFCAGLVILLLVQLVPLPPFIWTSLAGREVAVGALGLAGEGIDWRPISLTPHGTWLGLAALIPGLAVFLATLLLPWKERRRAVLLLVCLGVVASVVGLLQAGGGLRAGDISTPTDSHGFFVNRNHFAALLYCLLLFLSAFAIDRSKAMREGVDIVRGFKSYPPLIACFTGIVVFLAAVVLARSRAGIGLSIVALFGIAAMANSDERKTAALGPKRLIAGAVAVVLIFASQVALFRVMERFAEDPLGDSRAVVARNTWHAALAFLPFGSGFGSFVPIYQSFETPADAQVGVYMNRAHNELLEVLLETGMAGLVFIVLFGIWLGSSFWRVWRQDGVGGTPLDRLLMRAAALTIVLLLAHSLVDYPLRTSAMLAVFAMACGLLIEPLDRATGPSRIGDDRHECAVPVAGSAERPERTRAAPVSSTPGEAPAIGSVGGRARWGDDIAWPDAWQNSKRSEKPRSEPE